MFKFFPFGGWPGPAAEHRAQGSPFFGTSSQYRRSLVFQPIRAYFSKAFHCKPLCQASNVSSQYRHVLFIVSLQSARLKMKPWKGPRQCLELCSFLNLSMFLSIVGQAGQKGYPDHSQGHGGWGNFSGRFFCVFIFCSFIVILFAWQDLEEPQFANPTAASSTLQATWCPNTWKCLEHFHYFLI